MRPRRSISDNEEERRYKRLPKRGILKSTKEYEDSIPPDATHKKRSESPNPQKRRVSWGKIKVKELFSDGQDLYPRRKPKIIEQTISKHQQILGKEEIIQDQTNIVNQHPTQHSTSTFGFEKIEAHPQVFARDEGSRGNIYMEESKIMGVTGERSLGNPRLIIPERDIKSKPQTEGKPGREKYDKLFPNDPKRGDMNSRENICKEAMSNIFGNEREGIVREECMEIIEEESKCPQVRVTESVRDHKKKVTIMPPLMGRKGGTTSLSIFNRGHDNYPKQNIFGRGEGQELIGSNIFREEHKSRPRPPQPTNLFEGDVGGVSESGSRSRDEVEEEMEIRELDRSDNIRGDENININKKDVVRKITFAPGVDNNNIDIEAVMNERRESVEDIMKEREMSIALQNTSMFGEEEVQCRENIVNIVNVVERERRVTQKPNSSYQKRKEKEERQKEEKENRERERREQKDKYDKMTVQDKVKYFRRKSKDSTPKKLGGGRVQGLQVVQGLQGVHVQNIGNIQNIQNIQNIENVENVENIPNIVSNIENIDITPKRYPEQSPGGPRLGIEIMEPEIATQHIITPQNVLNNPPFSPHRILSDMPTPTSIYTPPPRININHIPHIPINNLRDIPSKPMNMTKNAKDIYLSMGNKPSNPNNYINPHKQTKLSELKLEPSAELAQYLSQIVKIFPHPNLSLDSDPIMGKNLTWDPQNFNPLTIEDQKLDYIKDYCLKEFDVKLRNLRSIINVLKARHQHVKEKREQIRELDDFFDRAELNYSQPTETMESLYEQVHKNEEINTMMYKTKFIKNIIGIVPAKYGISVELPYLRYQLNAFDGYLMMKIKLATESLSKYYENPSQLFSSNHKIQEISIYPDTSNFPKRWDNFPVGAGKYRKFITDLLCNLSKYLEDVFRSRREMRMNKLDMVLLGTSAHLLGLTSQFRQLSYLNSDPHVHLILKNEGSTIIYEVVMESREKLFELFYIVKLSLSNPRMIKELTLPLIKASSEVYNLQKAHPREGTQWSTELEESAQVELQDNAQARINNLDPKSHLNQNVLFEFFKNSLAMLDTNFGGGK